MKGYFFAYLICLLILSCGRMENRQATNDPGNRIVQQENGTLSLELDKAGRYTDVADPSNNTADWKIVISKPGRFKVWLTSATKDTSDLKFLDSVRISLLDNHLEGEPSVHKIVLDLDNPLFYKTDSYMGSVYVSEPGEYNIQMISEKVIPENMNTQIEDTKLMAVLLTPELR